MQDIHDQPDLIDTAAAARQLCRSEKTLIRYRRLRIGPPFVRLPTGRVLYSREQIRQWIQDQTIRAGAA